MKLIARKPHKVNGRQVQPGEEYEVSGRWPRIFTVLGWAELAPESLPMADVVAHVDVEPVRRKRVYRRRDLTAEG